MDPLAPKPQSFANHRAVPPAAYLLAGGVLLAEALRRGVELVRHPGWEPAWAVLVALALLVVWNTSRAAARTVQDRVIRDAMRLRLERLLPRERHGDIGRLGLNQVIALRFAGDAELPALVDEVLAGRLARPDDIKRRVKDWQADWLRV
jgi:hypothetical protein